ncbi:MAG: aminopeptidase [Anaerolineales bacterium]|nr:aminopeptidase [Anaerolineales bacterium]
MDKKEFDTLLEKYAELAVKIGLNLQPGQRLFIWAQQLEVAPLVREVAKAAYQNGSKLVSVLWNDDHLNLTRLENAPRDSFEEFPAWKTDARFNSMKRGDATLFIAGRDPELFKGQDPELVGKAARAYSEHFKPIMEMVARNSAQWCVVCPPTPDWAAAVFPDSAQEDAEGKLWDAVIKTCRLDQPDPVKYWQGYFDQIMVRGEYLTAKKYTALKYRAPGTNLTVGLPEGHLWIGGWDRTEGGITFAANLPSEEVFTLPHRDMTEGTVTATKPLVYQGSLIEDFSLTFSGGKVVDFKAKKGQDILENILESDPNARYLGETALVPHGTPISQLGLTFLNTLYDENASNHLALGNAYRFNLKGGTDMSEEQFAAAGGNESIIHEDFMFGSGEMDVDGILPDGAAEPVMRAGEWAFEV